MRMIQLVEIARYSGLVSFLIGLPTTVGTYLQVMRARREAKQAREGFVYSENCLEFLLEDGTFINLVPLESLHSLPKPGDVVLLPGGAAAALAYGAYRVTRLEHIYSPVVRVESKQALAGQARLAKAVAHVELVSGAD
jgi:hypothetical protein